MSVESPCVGICSLNPDNVCDGCFRTTDEIRAWSNSNDDEKRAILEKSQAREEADRNMVLG